MWRLSSSFIARRKAGHPGWERSKTRHEMESSPWKLSPENRYRSLIYDLVPLPFSSPFFSFSSFAHFLSFSRYFVLFHSLFPFPLFSVSLWLRFTNHQWTIFQATLCSLVVKSSPLANVALNRVKLHCEKWKRIHWQTNSLLHIPSPPQWLFFRSSFKFHYSYISMDFISNKRETNFLTKFAVLSSPSIGNSLSTQYDVINKLLGADERHRLWNPPSKILFCRGLVSLSFFFFFFL